MMYEIGKLISRIIGGDRAKRTQIVKRMGYTNLSKGYRRLDTLIRTGCIPSELLPKLAQALDTNLQTIGQALEETSVQKREEIELRDRRSFRPHIFIKTSRSGPEVGNITMVALVGLAHFKHIQLPVGTTEKPMSNQLKTVREIIRWYYQEHNGRCLFFGEITGYTYRSTYDHAVEFSIDGKLIEPFASTSLRGNPRATGAVFSGEIQAILARRVNLCLYRT